MSSPFTPHLGSVPKVFVGRDPEIKRFKATLKDAASDKPFSLLLTGQRGSGKTVLLKYFSGIAKESHFYPVYVGLDESTDTPRTLARKIYGKTKATLEESIISLKAKKLLKQIKPAVSITIKELEVQLSSSLNEEEINENNFVMALGRLIKNRRVSVFTDETQSVLRDGVARFLVNTLYTELPDYASNWIFILSGTPILEEKISKATPADRAFQKMRLENLDANDVKDLLQKTVKDTDVSFSKEACHLIANDTKGLPFYIQFFGDTLFNLIKSGEVGESFYSQNKNLVLKKLADAVFKQRLKELERRGLYYTVVTQLALLDREEGVSAKEISNKISAYAGTYIQDLEGKGIVIKVSRGKYRITDPLFRDWITNYSHLS